jgi:hypothetical protein
VYTAGITGRCTTALLLRHRKRPAPGVQSGEEVEGFNKDYDSSINAGLVLPPGVYHFAFNATSEEELPAEDSDKASRGVDR